MKIEIKPVDKEKLFNLLPVGEIFLDGSEAYMKIEEISSLDENDDANAVNLSTGALTWFGYNVKVIIPHSHNLLIEY